MPQDAIIQHVMAETKFSKLLRAFRKRAGLTQDDIADALGTKRQYASHLEKARVLAPNIDVCNRLADVLKLSPAERADLIEAAMREREGKNYLLFLEHAREKIRAEQAARQGGGVSSKNNVEVAEPGESFGRFRIPLLSLELCCGKMEEAYDEVLDWIPVPEEEYTDMRYFVRAKGDSMEPTIGDGELVLIDRAITPNTGDIVVAVCDDKSSLKRFYDAGPNGVELRSDNPAYPTIVISAPDQLEIRGVAVRVIKNLR